MGNKSALQLEVEKEMGFEIDEDLFAYLEHYARRKLEVANEHRHTYEIGKGVMDFLARDLLADFKAAGGLLPPVALDSDVYVIYRRKPVKAKVIFIGINADRLFFFNVLRGNIKANFQTYQFTENDIGRSVFLTLEEAEKAVA